MACNNGKTFLNSMEQFPGATATAASYLINLTHYTCGGRRICSLESFPVTADLNYKVQSIEQVGDGLYDMRLLATGSISYMPYVPNCPCGVCPVTEPIFAYLSVPVVSDTVPTITPGECICALNGISCRCNTSSSVDITAAFSIATTTTTSGSGGA